MEDILVFQHEPEEGLGTFAHILEEQKAGFRYIRLFRDEIPTESWDEVRALIILGGSMGIHEEEEYPFLKWEKSIIRTAIKNGIPLLGICLGAQLIAAAAGADVYQGNFKEIGWYPISITLEGEMDPLLGHIPNKALVFHWHGDSFDLPRGAQRLASSTYYQNQAFRLGKNVYGLQFHLEVTPTMVERWLDEHGKELAQIPYISPDKIRADTRSYSVDLKHYGERFFSGFIRRFSVSKGRQEEGSHAKSLKWNEA